MSEPGVMRTKSISQIAAQFLRLWNGIGREGSQARRDAISEAYVRYQLNMQKSPAMQRAMKAAGVKTEADKDKFMSSFGGSVDVQVPRSQYMRKNR